MARNNPHRRQFGGSRDPNAHGKLRDARATDDGIRDVAIVDDDVADNIVRMNGLLALSATIVRS
jgi:hypothetical protein